MVEHGWLNYTKKLYSSIEGRCIWPILCGYFVHEYGKNFIFKVAAHAPTKYQNTSTSGRGARASHRTMLPEISARRSLLEPSVRYLSPGREGEKCLPLDHTWQIPFIRSVRFMLRSHFYIYSKLCHIFHPCGKYMECLDAVDIGQLRMHSCKNPHLNIQAGFILHTVRTPAHDTKYIAIARACLLNPQNRPFSGTVNFCSVHLYLQRSRRQR